MADILGAIRGMVGGNAAAAVQRFKDMGDGSWAQVVSLGGSPAYPVGATPLLTSTGNKANAIGTATLHPATGKTMYLSGFEITGSGATAGLPVTVTVAGLLGGTLSYTYTFVAGALVGNLPLVVDYAPAIPASAVDTDIVITCPASGAGGTNNVVTAHGYYL